MKFRLKQLSFAATAAAAALTLAACGSGSATPEGSAGAGSGGAGITVYNAQHETMTQAWVDEFTAETGIKVNLRQGDDTEMSNQIIQEGDASPADVFITENSPAMTQVENAGLFADISDTVKANVPEEFRPSSDKWTGVAARSTVFVYNKDKLKEADLPKSLMDLADPKWAGKWGAAPGGADFQAIVSAMLELKGEQATADWLKAMKENAKVYPGNGAAMKAVNAGEIDSAVIYHYYYVADQAKTKENSANVATHYFKNQDPGAFLSISGAGVLKSSQHQEDAMKFVEFITSKKGQETLGTGADYEYPVGKDATLRAGLVPIEELEAPKVDPAKLNGQQVVELMTNAGLL
ncbi:iron ABC transporter substrate-binding protein [Arthrobacter sp. I2-34]|uniref:Iron ABC transporter substrate-binding protein n=1 Tax=Arthrobacter hankyongi TaxID=2904801 RepID=A0ABS9L824_9MICC|nr:iron ABC transporter substrate-binding protein [Arthrobacter hankyongi]MCG2622830.1 iron ABC transporter substrate-binding protein [Arthrobacter hankyongi]